MKKLLQVLNDFEKQAPLYLNNNKMVSEANVGWHIMHSCLVITSISEAIRKSDPSLYKKKFSWKAFFVLLLNKIPRGKAKAPKVVQPLEPATAALLISKLEIAKNSLVDLETLNANSYFTHPYFGDLNLKKTLWFLNLHTNHHLKIIKDIAHNV